jgi:hypothetical protein
MFFKGSRYADVETHETRDVQGRVLRYKKVRFIPPTPAQQRHAVRADERLDHIAERYYHDPERFWRICDANVAMWPNELVATTGQLILIPAAKG